MKGKKRVLPTTLPKALLPDPDSVLHYIDRALTAAEYARASQFLANVPPGPRIFSVPSPHCPPTVDAISKSGSLLRSSWVEEFLNKVTIGEVRESSKHGVKSSITTDNGTGRPWDRSTSETPGLQPHHSLVKICDSLASSIVEHSESESIKTSSDLQTVYVDSLKETSTELNINSTAFQGLASGVAASKFSKSKLRIPNSECDSISPSVQSNDDYQESGATGASRSSRRFDSHPTGSSPSIACSNKRKGTPLAYLAGQQSEFDRKYDAAGADEAYRAGSAAMEEGDMVQAIALLRLASIRCPPDKISAILKIGKLMTAATNELEMQEASRNIAEREVSATEQEPSTAEQPLGRQQPMKILVVGNMLKADEAYRAGVAAVEAGKPDKALEHLQKAALACPEDRHTAASKIQTLIEQANFELRMR